MHRMNGRTAIITGATSGMGRATALLFAREGAAIVASGRDEARGRELEAQIRSGGRPGRVRARRCQPSRNQRQARGAVRPRVRRPRHDRLLRGDARPRLRHRCAARHVAADDRRQPRRGVLPASGGTAGHEGARRGLGGRRRVDRGAEGFPEPRRLLRLEGRAAGPGPAGGHRLRPGHPHQRALPGPGGHAAHLGLGLGVSGPGPGRLGRCSKRP